MINLKSVMNGLRAGLKSERCRRWLRYTVAVLTPVILHACYLIGWILFWYWAFPDGTDFFEGVNLAPSAVAAGLFAGVLVTRKSALAGALTQLVVYLPMAVMSVHLLIGTIAYGGELETGDRLANLVWIGYVVDGARDTLVAALFGWLGGRFRHQIWEAFQKAGRWAGGRLVHGSHKPLYIVGGLMYLIWVLVVNDHFPEEGAWTDLAYNLVFGLVGAAFAVLLLHRIFVAALWLVNRFHRWYAPSLGYDAKENWLRPATK